MSSRMKLEYIVHDLPMTEKLLPVLPRRRERKPMSHIFRVDATKPEALYQSLREGGERSRQIPYLFHQTVSGLWMTIGRLSEREAVFTKAWASPRKPKLSISPFQFRLVALSPCLQSQT